MVRLEKILLSCSVGSIKASNRNNGAVAWPWTSDVFMLGVGQKDPAWKTVDINPVGNVTEFKNVKYLDYGLIGKRLQTVEADGRMWENRMDDLNTQKSNGALAEAHSRYRGAKKDEYDELRLTSYLLNRVEEMLLMMGDSKENLQLRPG